MGYSDYQVHKWLSEMDNVWLALHYDNPEIAGAYASEVFGGSYTRQRCNMTDPSSRAVFNVDAIKFSGLPNIQITHLTGWDAKVNGNYLFSCPLPQAVRITAGQSYTVMSSTIALSMT